MPMIIGLIGQEVYLIVVKVLSFNKGKKIQLNKLLLRILFLFFLYDWVHDKLWVFTYFLGLLRTGKGFQEVHVPKGKRLVFEELSVGSCMMADMDFFLTVEHQDLLTSGGESHPDWGVNWWSESVCFFFIGVIDAPFKLVLFFGVLSGSFR